MRRWSVQATSGQPGRVARGGRDRRRTRRSRPTPVPDGLLLEGLLDEPLPDEPLPDVPPPLELCADASAGARPRTTTIPATISFSRVPSRSYTRSSTREESPDRALKECPSGSTEAMAIKWGSGHQAMPRHAAQEGSVTKLILAGLIVTVGFAPALVLAQTSGESREPAPAQGEERMVVGQVQSVDESGTELTLTDGTKLLTPPGSRLRPGVLNEGMLVVAMYREENGGKILTRLSLGQSAPAPTAPEDSPKR